MITTGREVDRLIISLVVIVLAGFIAYSCHAQRRQRDMIHQNKTASSARIDVLTREINKTKKNVHEWIARPPAAAGAARSGAGAAEERSGAGAAEDRSGAGARGGAGAAEDRSGAGARGGAGAAEDRSGWPRPVNSFDW